MDVYFWAALFEIIAAITSLVLFCFFIIDRFKEKSQLTNKPQQQEKQNIILLEKPQKKGLQKSKRKFVLISAITLSIICIASLGITFVVNQLSPQFHIGPTDTQPYRNLVKALSWSPDGKQVASASYDGVRVWDIATDQNYSIPQADANTVAWSPKGNFIAYGVGNVVQILN